MSNSTLDFNIIVTEHAFKSRLLTVQIQNNFALKDPKIFLEESCKVFPKIIEKVDLFPCKINSSLIGKFIVPKVSNDNEVEERNLISDIKYINTKNVIFFESSNPVEWFVEHILEKILKKFSEFAERLSGWSLVEIISLEIKINKCSLFSTCGTFIDLPDEIKFKRACVNIKSADSFCFAWAVAASFQNVSRNVNHVSSYKHFSEFLNLDGIEFPFSLKQLSKFEKQNNMSVNIFGLKQRKTKDK